ncbi:MAG: hypothetical protein R3324_00150 [Halobacteriales archaeon]|nr:hypothetical protein [Halobacteriales archaeon]
MTEKFEASGEHALSTIKAALSSLDVNDSNVARIAVEVDFEETVDPEPAANGSVEPSRRSLSVTNRELKQIQPGTNHHVVLSWLAEHGPARSVDGPPALTGRLSSTLTELYQRRLVTREGPKPYTYDVSGYGTEELRRLPPVEETDADPETMEVLA